MNLNLNTPLEAPYSSFKPHLDIGRGDCTTPEEKLKLKRFMSEIREHIKTVYPDLKIYTVKEAKRKRIDTDTAIERTLCNFPTTLGNNHDNICCVERLGDSES